MSRSRLNFPPPRALVGYDSFSCAQRSGSRGSPGRGWWLCVLSRRHRGVSTSASAGGHRAGSWPCGRGGSGAGHRHAARGLWRRMLSALLPTLHLGWGLSRRLLWILAAALLVSERTPGTASLQRGIAGRMWRDAVLRVRSRSSGTLTPAARRGNRVRRSSSARHCARRRRARSAAPHRAPRRVCGCPSA